MITLDRVNTIHMNSNINTNMNRKSQINAVHDVVDHPRESGDSVR